MQEVLFLTTEHYSLRAEVVGWGHEDPRLFQRGQHIGKTRCPPPYTPRTVLEALADGWHLLGDPTSEKLPIQRRRRKRPSRRLRRPLRRPIVTYWSWALVRSVPVVGERGCND